MPDEKWGERPLAVVALSQRIDEDISDDLKQHLSVEFPKFWIPDRFVIVDEIPKTSVGKSDKRAILERLASQNLGDRSGVACEPKLA